MGLRRLAALATASAWPLALLAALPAPASAWGHRHRHARRPGPPAGYAVPLQEVFQFPAALVFQPTRPDGYAVPLQEVFQFPAALVDQPGGAFGPIGGPIAGPHR